MIEIERMLMTREDARSRDVKKASHLAKFSWKDLPPPKLPKVLEQLGLVKGTEEE